ncbi:hypothetical protein AV530_005880 [Patagioenas fasciata monilis]|uniref:Uncharacterized protein n=1 Tax=Patagioenas fasciata monilis TaxID=372326 RepID=A0A1V4JMZ6_PATFA|nr:hypothetical protein AV530_005880 [Patagioenas fasciata monilis]
MLGGGGGRGGLAGAWCCAAAVGTVRPQGEAAHLIEVPLAKMVANGVLSKNGGDLQHCPSCFLPHCLLINLKHLNICSTSLSVPYAEDVTHTIAAPQPYLITPL